MVDRRSRHGADHQAQADDGFGRPLRAPRIAEPRDQRPARAMLRRCSPQTACRSPDHEHEPDAPMTADACRPRPRQQLMTELQSFGLRLVDPASRRGVASRRGGAGALRPQGRHGRRPHDHGAGAHRERVELAVRRAQRPTRRAAARSRAAASRSRASRFPKAPRFYALQTFDGVPYSKIATLHGARRAGDHRAADLHPLREPPKDLPVLRDRPVARGRPHHRAQDAAATRRGRARRGANSTASSTW
jgi:hypothetical protein